MDVICTAALILENTLLWDDRMEAAEIFKDNKRGDLVAGEVMFFEANRSFWNFVWADFLLRFSEFLSFKIQSLSFVNRYSRVYWIKIFSEDEARPSVLTSDSANLPHIFSFCSGRSTYMNFNTKLFRLRLYQWSEILDLCMPFSILITSSLYSMSFTDLRRENWFFLRSSQCPISRNFGLYKG